MFSFFLSFGNGVASLVSMLNRCFCISEEKVFSIQWLELELSFKISRNALPDEVD